MHRSIHGSGPARVNPEKRDSSHIRQREQREPLTLPEGLVLSGTDEDFALVVDWYKKAKRRPFPSWSEVLEIAKLLGWRKPDAKV